MKDVKSLNLESGVHSLDIDTMIDDDVPYVRIMLTRDVDLEDDEEDFDEGCSCYYYPSIEEIDTIIDKLQEMRDWLKVAEITKDYIPAKKEIDQDFDNNPF
jgi:hypothetical protein